MRLHRFFVEEDLSALEDKYSGGIVFINNSDITHQIRHVFRFTIGGQLILMDGSGKEYHVMVSQFKQGGFEAKVISVQESKTLVDKELCLFCSVTKKDKFEWIVEKGTEIGVSKFIPIISRRSEKKNLNFERLKKIAKESAEQSGRAVIPKIEKIIDIENALEEEIPMIAFSPEGEDFVIEKVYRKSPLGVFIGPEGGWSDGEIKMFKDNKVSIYSLGPAILRAETAAIAVSSLILFS